MAIPTFEPGVVDSKSTEELMDQAHHEIFKKIAQDAGAPEAAAPGFVTGLSPQDEWLIRKRTAAAAKLRHLPPELAYALTGEMPITDSPAANIELQRALERASSRGRSKLVGLGYGLPAAAAGAVLGHLLTGEPAGAAAGGLVAGGGVGYMAHRGEREGQRRLGGQLAMLRTQYQMAQQQAAMQEQQALQELAQAQALEQQNQQMRRRKPKGQRKAAQADFNASVIEQLRRRSKKGLPRMGLPRTGLPKTGGLMSGIMDDKPMFDAGDPSRHTRRSLPWPRQDQTEEVSAEAPTYIGRFGGEKYGSVDEAIWGDVRAVLARMRELEKAGQGIQTGNQMGIGGAGAMKPPSPSGGGMGSAAQAPRLTASPSAAGMAPKPPPGLSGQNTAVQSQPKPKTYNLGPTNNLASGAPPAVSQPPVMPAGLTAQ